MECVRFFMYPHESECKMGTLLDTSLCIITVGVTGGQEREKTVMRLSNDQLITA